MRIVITGPFFFPQLDGVEKVMLSHARHLVRRGHEVHVVTSGLRYPKGSFPDALGQEEMEGFRIHRLPVRIANAHWRFSYLNNGGVVVEGLVQRLREIAPDVLHAHQIAAPAWALGAAFYARTRGRRFFYSPHWHPDTEPSRRRPATEPMLLHAMNWLPLATARRIFHLTSLDLAPFALEYPWVPAARQAVLPNGVQSGLPHARSPRPSSEVVLLFVGRVDEHRKGFDLLRQAFAQARRPGWRLEVIGRISEATRAGLEVEFGPAVRVHGLVTEAALDRAYAEADIFVMPSRYEGFGIPYIEAMRYGTPVIGTRVGGVPEVVPTDTGLLVPPDDVPTLSAALRQLADDPAGRARMGEAGRRWAEGFGWDRIVERLEREYAAG
ncbi:glycosyltransferase family 4 protein [Belnapia moabensis]|uniref:glycosyltransferase family 4 protein n=1 Tax=Belnapia moabensis TaxID=365533 RepID=UPI000694D01B|nr:glycosyltransferase family 4 protein [Belnapia moabensis]